MFELMKVVSFCVCREFYDVLVLSNVSVMICEYYYCVVQLIDDCGVDLCFKDCVLQFIVSLVMCWCEFDFT